MRWTEIDDIDQRLDAMDLRMDKMDQRFDGIDQRFDGIDQRFDGIDQRFDGIESQLNEHTMLLRALEERSKVHSAELHDVKFSLDTFEGSFTNVDKRISGLETMVRSLDANMVQLNKKVSTIEVVTSQNWNDIARMQVSDEKGKYR